MSTNFNVRLRRSSHVFKDCLAYHCITAQGLKMDMLIQQLLIEKY